MVASRPRWSIAPYFIVDDVVATANLYREKMGFRYERFWGEPPCFCMVKRGGIIIMLSQLAKTGVTRPNRVADPNGDAWDAYVWRPSVWTLPSPLRGSKSGGTTFRSRSQ